MESEKSPDILSRALGVAPGILDTLLAEGNWRALLGTRRTSNSHT